MAYEISEGAAAAALLLSTNELNKLNTKNLIPAMRKIYNIIKHPSKIKMSAPEREAYSAWFNPDTITQTILKANPDARLTAIVHGYSTALAVKKWFKSSQHKETNDTVDAGKVYLTGGLWHKDIKFLQVNVNNWTDYNSSDLMVIKGKCYYGISLKKKEKASSADPPMINKSVVALLKDLNTTKIADDFYNSRGNFFGGIVEKSIKSGALKGTIGKLTKTKLFEAKVLHPFKSGKEWVNLIDLKGEGALDLTTGDGQYEWKANQKSFVKGVKTKTLKEFQANPKVRALFGYNSKTGTPLSETQWKMRKEVNAILGSDNKFFDQITQLARGNKLPEKIGKYLVSAVLKTELEENISALPEIKKGRHFGFALVTALGKVSNGKMGPLTSAIVKNNPTIQANLGKMMQAVKNGKWQIIVDKKTTEAKRLAASKKGNAPPAKLFFKIGIGTSNKLDYDILNLEVRYKGSFSPSPQFLGVMTKEFQTILESKDEHKEYKFGKACK